MGSSGASRELAFKTGPDRVKTSPSMIMIWACSRLSAKPWSASSRSARTLLLRVAIWDLWVARLLAGKLWSALFKEGLVPFFIIQGVELGKRQIRLLRGQVI